MTRTSVQQAPAPTPAPVATIADVVTRCSQRRIHPMSGGATPFRPTDANRMIADASTPETKVKAAATFSALIQG